MRTAKKVAFQNCDSSDMRFVPSFIIIPLCSCDKEQYRGPQKGHFLVHCSFLPGPGANVSPSPMGLSVFLPVNMYI
jgi:hypothetical protein